MLTFQIEKPVFVREYSSQLYSLTIYFYTKMLFELPMIIIAPMVQLLIVYWGVGCLPGVLPFMNTYLVILVLALSAAGLGLLVGSISGSATESPALATALTFPMILFCGLVRNLSTMPSWYSWLQYLSPPRFALNGLLISQWSNSQIFSAVYTNVLGFGNFTLYECVYSILGLSGLFLLLSFVTLWIKIDKF
jgi:ABC-type multidrug transport system permease subunit